jgi:SAM-dependent methyltransferase
MNPMIRVKNAWRGAVQRWGFPSMKRRLWNQEFATGRWDAIERTPGDMVYPFVEKYCRGGSLLDLGCGSGNTGCELAANSYEEYTGVDISDVAIEKARLKSQECQRGQKNHYIQADISSYVPAKTYDAILFRESIYYLPRTQINATLERYSRCLTGNGVIIIRWHARNVAEGQLKLIGGHLKTIEYYSPDPAGPVVVIFRPQFNGPATVV